MKKNEFIEMADGEHKLKGAALMVLACVSFTAMASLIKLVLHIDAYKTSMFRFIVGMALLGSAALGGKIQLVFNNGRLLFLRGLFGGAGVFIAYLSIVKLGMGKGIVLVSTYPIFACIFGAVLLKEKLGLKAVLAVLTAFIGIYFLSAGENAGTTLFSSFGVYEVIAVFGGLVGGLAIVIVRKLHKTDSSYAIFFSQCLVGFWLVVVPANIKSCTIGFKSGIILVLIGVAATVGQLFMTQSYKYLPVRTGSVIGMLEPVLNFVVGVLIFNEIFSGRSVFGTSLIVGSCVAVLLQRRGDNIIGEGVRDTFGNG